VRSEVGAGAEDCRSSAPGPWIEAPGSRGEEKEALRDRKDGKGFSGVGGQKSRLNRREEGKGGGKKELFMLFRKRHEGGTRRRSTTSSHDNDERALERAFGEDATKIIPGKRKKKRLKELFQENANSARERGGGLPSD